MSWWQSNIFSIAFARDGRRLFTASNDALVTEHDIETAHSTRTESPTDVWLDHDVSVLVWYGYQMKCWLMVRRAVQDSVHRVTCHPLESNRFMTAR